MKELTIEQKAKAYDEAKARMSKAYNSNRCTISFMNEIFPEIKESDERIKEEIINYFKRQSRDEPCRKSIHDKWIAWLEKQGNIDKASCEIAEKEKYDFVSGQFIECRKSFNEFKEGNSYWFEYVGNDTYIGRSDNVLNKKFHITPRQLYCLFTQQHCPKENNVVNEETNAPTAYGKYVDECLNDAAKHFFSEGEDKYSVADLFYAGVRCGQSCLENKGQTFTKKDVDDAYLKGISDTKKELEKQGKSALEAVKEEKVDDSNKFKPRFEVGKWIVWQGKCYKVYNNSFGYELLDQDDFITLLEYGTVDETARFWDITKDAKDGDVLVDAYGNIGVYKSHDEFNWKSYCSLGCNRGFKGFEVEHENDKTHPATKEQLDILTKEWLPQDILLILKSKYKM